MNVLDYIEDTPRALLKSVVTVKRAQTSKSLFYLLVRHYRIETRKTPTFLPYVKSEMSSVRGMLEEISIFGGGELFVLEGFPASFVSDLILPKGVIVLAEVEDGELEAPPYSYKFRRQAVKIMAKHLGLMMSLRDLLSLDWGAIRDYSDIEVFLRKSVAAGWSLADMEKELSANQTGNILLLLKKGGLAEVLKVKEKYGDGWLSRHLTKLVPQLATYRSLVNMGQNEQACAEVLGVSNYRMKEFEEAAKAVTMADLKILAERLITLDRISLRHQRLGDDLIALRSGISLKR